MENTQTKRNLKAPLIGVFVLLILIVIGWFAYSALSSATYVRILDVTQADSSNSPSPGVDIQGVEVVRGEKSYFAEDVASENILEGSAQQSNEHVDTKVALGDPAEHEDALESFVSLGGNGGEIVLKIGVDLQAGDMLIVHELGSKTNASREKYEVYTSDKESGPWELQGSGGGPTEITVK